MKNIIKFFILITLLPSFGFCNSTNTERIGLRVNDIGRFESYLYLYNQKNIYNIDTDKSNQWAKNLNHHMEMHNLNVYHLIKQHFFFDKNVLYKQRSQHIFDAIVKVAPPRKDITIDLHLKDNTIVAAHVSASDPIPDTFNLFKTRWDCLGIHLFHFFNDYKMKNNITFYFPKEVSMNFMMRNPLTSNLLPGNYDEVCKSFFDSLTIIQRDSSHSYAPLPTLEVSHLSPSSSSIPPQTIAQDTYDTSLHEQELKIREDHEKQQRDLERDTLRHKIPHNVRTQGNLLPPISSIFKEIEEYSNKGQTMENHYTNVQLQPLYFPISPSNADQTIADITNGDITVKNTTSSSVTRDNPAPTSQKISKTPLTWISCNPKSTGTSTPKSTRKPPLTSYCHKFQIPKKTPSDSSNSSSNHPNECYERNASLMPQQTSSLTPTLNHSNTQSVPPTHSYAFGDVLPDNTYRSVNTGSRNDITNTGTSASNLYPIHQVQPFQYQPYVYPQPVGIMPFTYTNQSFSGFYYPSNPPFYNPVELQHQPTTGSSFSYHSNRVPVPTVLTSSSHTFPGEQVPQIPLIEQSHYGFKPFSQHFK